MTRTAVKILALIVAACAFTLCALAGGAPALATNDPSPLATGSIPANLLVLFQQASAASHVRGAMDTARRSGEDRIVV